MFPEAPPSGTAALPVEATFWMPEPDEIDEESGIGYFRDTWPMTGITVADAQFVVAAEYAMAEAIELLAHDADDFERLAVLTEYGGIDDPDYDMTEDERTALTGVVSDIPDELGGLELGVSGLVHALAAVGIVPAASCRSHADPVTSWSVAPVVIFAASEDAARALQSLVEASGCTFELNQDHPDLLAVRGRSITNTMALAEAVLEHRNTFR